MNLHYAIKQYKQARAERKEAEEREQKYRLAIMSLCPEDTEVDNLKITWHRTHRIDLELMAEDGIDVDSYRMPTGWTARLTVGD